MAVGIGVNVSKVGSGKNVFVWKRGSSRSFRYSGFDSISCKRSSQLSRAGFGVGGSMGLREEY
jgi:hypothetical protein